MFVASGFAEDQRALDYLCSREEVDAIKKIDAIDAIKKIDALKKSKPQKSKLYKSKLKSLKKRFKNAKFAANVERNLIERCEGAGLSLDEFFELTLKALELGATDEGPPGDRIPNVFYGAYVRDLDGNKLCFFEMKFG